MGRYFRVGHYICVGCYYSEYITKSISQYNCEGLATSTERLVTKRLCSRCQVSSADRLCIVSFPFLYCDNNLGHVYAM